MAFLAQDAIGLAWAADGVCHAVRVRRQGDRHQVLGHWSGRAESPSALPEILRQGWQELSSSDSVLLCGASDAAFALAEQSLPGMPPEETTQALEMSLQRLFPSSREEQVWGWWRPESGPLRVVSMRRSIWEHWCDACALVRPDLIVPPGLLSDVVAKGVFPLEKDGEGWLCLVAEDGRLLSSWCDSSDYLGAAAKAGVDLGGLSSASDREAWAPALALALAGTSIPIGSASRGLPPVPPLLRPKRYQGLKLITAFSLAACALLLAVQGLRMWGASSAAAERRRAQVAAIEAEIRSLKLDPDLSLALDGLDAELRDKVEKPPSARALLHDFTVALPDAYYCKTLRISSGRLAATVFSSNGAQQELYNALKAAPGLDDDITINPNPQGASWSIEVKPVADATAVSLAAGAAR
ncbi:MAG: hypothetical protein RL095_3612 [Verrucomicrobiota bacterium]|jgi:hypothetical protein